MINMNTKEYWEQRFSSGDWEDRRGRKQTADFARAQVPRFGLPKDFSGKLLDFGCGLGDAIPVYREAFLDARLQGLDISVSAIEQCRHLYGRIATFSAGTHLDVGKVDVIVASNVFEHLDDDLGVAKCLLEKCKLLIITVPYNEDPLCNEHVRAYDEHYFDSLGRVEHCIFLSKGWSEYGRNLWRLNVENAWNRVLSRPTKLRRSQVMFKIPGISQ